MILQQRVKVLARETGCIERQRKFTGANLAQTLIFSLQEHAEASLTRWLAHEALLARFQDCSPHTAREHTVNARDAAMSFI